MLMDAASQELEEREYPMIMGTAMILPDDSPPADAEDRPTTYPLLGVVLSGAWPEGYVEWLAGLKVVASAPPTDRPAPTTTGAPSR